MLHVKITFYKPSGKFYLESELKEEKDIPLWSNVFLQKVLAKAPHITSEWFVVTTDLPEGEGFHNHVFHGVILEGGKHGSSNGV